MTSLTMTGICFLASVLVTSSQESWRFTGYNVALNKVAEQGPGTYYVYNADRAVDGNTDTSTSNGHCSVTTRVYNTAAYWSVYLVDTYILKGIRLYNSHLYNYKERLSNFQVIGYPSWTLLHDDRTAIPQLCNNLVIDIPVYTTTAFSNVTVLVPAHTGWPDNGYSQLTLCEVEIYAGSSEPVDGGWTDWSVWTSCSVTCGSGQITRTRTCTNPAPQYNGADCSGDDTDETTCVLGICPIGGGWTDWSSWTSCSVTCGSGLITRTRTCTNPAPQYNGSDCSGYATEETTCVLGNCPIDGGWTDWLAWTSCSVTCGTGDITTARTCTNPTPQYGGVGCPGYATDETTCVLGSCTRQLSQNQEVAGHNNATVVGVACGAFVGGLVIGLLVVFVIPKCKRRTAKTPTAGEGIYCTPQETQPTDIHNYDTLSL